MKASLVYEQVKSWRDTCTGNVHPVILGEMDILMETCYKEMLQNEAKRGGTKSICSAANRIIKNAKTTNKEILCGMFPNTLNTGETVWCVCDSFCAVRFKDKMSLEEVDMSKGDVFHLENICKKPNNAYEIKLPNIVDVKLAAKENIVKNNKGKKVGMKPYCINADMPLYVNPQYLLNMMECLPDCKVYAADSISAIYFEADNGDGVLLPVKPPKKGN